MTKVNRWLVGCAVTLTGALLACSSGTQTTTVTLTPGDASYEAHALAVAAHLAEVEESRLALTTASAPTVRAFAQQMVRDHSSALQKAQTLGKPLGFDWAVPAPAASADGALPAADNSAAGVSNWTFATSPMGKNETVLARSKWATEVMENHRQAVPAMITWMPLGGAQFDREFMQRQVALHRYVLESIDRIFPSVTDMTVRSALASDRTSIASHLRMAEQVLQNAQ